MTHDNLTTFNLGGLWFFMNFLVLISSSRLLMCADVIGMELFLNLIYKQLKNLTENFRFSLNHREEKINLLVCIARSVVWSFLIIFVCVINKKKCVMHSKWSKNSLLLKSFFGGGCVFLKMSYKNEFFPLSNSSLHTSWNF